MRSTSAPANYVTLPELGRLVGLTAQTMYRLVQRGTGPLTRPLGRQQVVPFGAAVSWAEDRLKWDRLSAAKRRALEDAVRELRVRWAFNRADQRRRQYTMGRYPRPPVEEAAA
jgi:predicted DNA-binding transcriptional regulator AlpA